MNIQKKKSTITGWHVHRHVSAIFSKWPGTYQQLCLLDKHGRLQKYFYTLCTLPVWYYHGIQYPPAHQQDPHNITCKVAPCDPLENSLRNILCTRVSDNTSLKFFFLSAPQQNKPQVILLHDARHSSAALAIMQCPCVCLSRSYILSKRINISSNFFHHWVATPFQFFRIKRHDNILTGTPLIGAPNAGGVGRNRDSEPTCCEPFQQQVQYHQLRQTMASL